MGLEGCLQQDGSTVNWGRGVCMFGGGTQRIRATCGHPPLLQLDSGSRHSEKVSSLGKDWHKLCLKCDRCNKLLNAGGHAEVSNTPPVTHDGRPYCHKPCYAALFGPKGVNIGGAGSYVYDTPANNNPSPTCVDSAPKAEEKRVFAPKAASKAGGITTFSGEANLCPRCNKKVYFGVNTGGVGSYIYEKEPSAVTQP
ncbi:Cysteine-rich protein 2 [Collichthys lucidus]|uniref:Cysteine-rich protein 2 n=1 Tax=Collichthys lucidus TaxID=240159 RepID=A0A4U5VIM7_COLLU|nr:Cysteine-rich protein 2 [Collichthys lucidus]